MFHGGETASQRRKYATRKVDPRAILITGMNTFKLTPVFVYKICYVVFFITRKLS